MPAQRQPSLHPRCSAPLALKSFGSLRRASRYVLLACCVAGASSYLRRWIDLRGALIGSLGGSDLACSMPSTATCALPKRLVLGQHNTNAKVNEVLHLTQQVVDKILSGEADPSFRNPTSLRSRCGTKGQVVYPHQRVYANSYVDLGKAEVLGFDYDYTLVHYKQEVLHLIYELATEELVGAMKYPEEMQDVISFDPKFAVRGLAVDIETGWICAITYARRVSTAFFGHERVSDSEIRKMYRSKSGSGTINVEARKQRMRPLNDLFSIAEACLLADVVQWFKDRKIRFDPRSVVTDVSNAIGRAHTSGAMHRRIADNLDRYVEVGAQDRLRTVLVHLKRAGKKLMLVSNSMFWYVDAGMTHVIGDDWRSLFDVVVVSAGKPDFYTGSRPFREVSTRTGRVKFKPVTSLEPDEVYCHGSLVELMRLTQWCHSPEDGCIDGSKVIYLGDSLFADLVEARRLYGWTTGAVIREISDEMEVQRSEGWRQTSHVLQVLFHCKQLCQEAMGLESPADELSTDPDGVGIDRQQPYSEADIEVLDRLEGISSEWRKRQNAQMNPNFGSIFRASKDDGKTAVPSLFARCLQRHVDFYTSRVENLRFYSTDHRFYPNNWNTGVLHEASHAMDSIIDLIDAVNQSL